MPKFRKTAVIDAVQFDAANPILAPGVCYGWPVGANEMHPLTGKYWVSTMHGPVEVNDGDWIVPEPELGKYYPIAPWVLAMQYEPVD